MTHRDTILLAMLLLALRSRPVERLAPRRDRRGGWQRLPHHRRG